jgi:hypothetical protein
MHLPIAQDRASGLPHGVVHLDRDDAVGFGQSMSAVICASTRSMSRAH